MLQAGAGGGERTALLTVPSNVAPASNPLLDLEIVAVQDETPAPGTARVFTTLTSEGNTPTAAINDAGQVAFIGKVGRAGTGNLFDGVWLKDPGQPARLLLLEGDQIDMAKPGEPANIRTVTDIDLVFDVNADDVGGGEEPFNKVPVMTIGAGEPLFSNQDGKGSPLNNIGEVVVKVGFDFDFANPIVVDEAIVVLNPRCPLEFDGNGVLNFADLSAFTDEFFNNPTNPRLDIDQNGFVNFNDLSAYTMLFFDGPLPPSCS